jgi:predicted ATPase
VAQGAIAEIDEQWHLCVPVEEVTQGVPESLRQLIEKHIERLSEEQQRLLEAASVVGHEFSAAAVAASLETTVEQMEERCEELVRRGQFLRAVGLTTLPDGMVAGRYGFLHSLYQTMLYERVPAIRRVRLHRRVGESEERAYGARAGEIAAELAVHFERGQDAQRAVKYLQLAAENVLKRHAHREAAAYQHRALALLSTLPDTPEKRQEELALQIALGVSLTITKGFADPEVEQTYARARELCQQIGNAPTLVPILYGLWNFHLVRSELPLAQELADQLLVIAEREQATAFLLAAHNAQARTLCQTGNFVAAHPHVEQVLAFYEPSTHNVLAGEYGEDLGVSCWMEMVLVLWQMGYPYRAAQHAQAIKKIAQDLSDPVSLVQALHFGGQLYYHLRHTRKVRETSEALITLCREHDFTLWLAGGRVLRGWVFVEEGQEQKGIAEIHQGMIDWQATGAECLLPLIRAIWAEAYGKAGQPQEGLAVVEEALAVTQTSGEVWYDAELYRLKGELSLQARQVQGKSKASHTQVKRKSPTPNPHPLIPNPRTEAEECFLKAIEIAQQQQAKSLELRAAMSLSRLWQQQGRKKEAHQLLAEIYGWFTEGFDTTDLRDAKALLDAWG